MASPPETGWLAGTDPVLVRYLDIYLFYVYDCIYIFCCIFYESVVECYKFAFKCLPFVGKFGFLMSVIVETVTDSQSVNIFCKVGFERFCVILHFPMGSGHEGP